MYLGKTDHGYHLLEKRTWIAILTTYNFNQYTIVPYSYLLVICLDPIGRLHALNCYQNVKCGVQDDECA